MRQLLNKKPTQNTKQNHVPIKKKVAEGHLQKVQNTPPTTRLSPDTRHAPVAKQETNTDHKAKPYAIQKKVAFKQYKTRAQPLDSHKILDMSQLLDKKQTRDTKQNICLLKRRWPKATFKKYKT